MLQTIQSAAGKAFFHTSFPMTKTYIQVIY